MSREKNSNRGKVNIKYIAKIADVSPSTVSRSLRGDPNANEDTRQRILKIAERLNYYPNLLAKGLRNKRTKTIGVILNDLKNPLYYEIINSIGKILNEHDYTMLLCDSNYDQKLEKKNIISMLSKGVDGIIISPVNVRSENIDLIRDNYLTTVYIDNRPAYQDINYVYVDHTLASFIATEYLIKKGHEEILLLNGPVWLSSSKDFMRGYLNVLKKYNIPARKNLIKYINLSIDDSFKAFKNCYNSREKNNFTAIVCLSDIIAIGVYEAAKKIKFNIPGDYSVIGYDNIISTAYLSPPLTTIHQPKIRTGVYSAEILIKQIEDNAEFEKIILKPRLVIRDSVKKK